MKHHLMAEILKIIENTQPQAPHYTFLQINECICV